MNDRKPLAAGTLADAEQALAELKTELCDAGVVLPSVRLDPVGCSAESPYFLVELGRCNIEVTRRITRVLKKSKGEMQDAGESDS